MSVTTLRARPDATNAPRGGSSRPRLPAGPEPTTPPPARSWFLGHVARTTRASARSNGVVFAVRELGRTEILLRMLRTHVLARPAGGASGTPGLMMIELLIAREALARSGRRALSRSR